MLWQTSRFTIDLAVPRVMGIVNVTPDSFSDGGEHASTASALRHCEQLIRDGADILDIGGESSRPAAVSVPLQQELARVVPVIREAVKLGVPISVDTCKPEVMQAVLDLGADIINDIRALQGPADASRGSGPAHAMQIVSRHPRCGLCLMHMHRDPQTMQRLPMTGDVVSQILQFWKQAIQQLQALEVDLLRVVLDPGIGFGKTVAQNFELLARQHELLAAGRPLLLGWSRKSSLALACGAAPGDGATTAGRHDRMVPSVAAALMAVERGAAIVRVHDVHETVQAFKVLAAVKDTAKMASASVLPPPAG